MGWFFQILPFLVFLFIVGSIGRRVVQALKQLNPPPSRPAQRGFDPGEAERTRRIQEEIRRKIAERRGARDQAPAPEQPSQLPEPTVEPPVIKSARTAANLERQEQLAERMRALEAARLAAQRRAAEAKAIVETAPTEIAAISTAGSREALLADLRSPTTTRRAILLREVLGPPVALR